MALNWGLGTSRVSSMNFLLVGANNSSMPRCPLWQNQSLGGFLVWLLLGVVQSAAILIDPLKVISWHSHQHGQKHRCST
jgi:hypothetical protein